MAKIIVKQVRSTIGRPEAQIKIVKALNLSADALLLDGMDQVNDSIVAELSVRLGRLSDEDRNRILNAIRALTE